MLRASNRPLSFVVTSRMTDFLASSVIVTFALWITAPFSSVTVPLMSCDCANALAVSTHRSGKRSSRHFFLFRFIHSPYGTQGVMPHGKANALSRKRGLKLESAWSLRDHEASFSARNGFFQSNL